MIPLYCPNENIHTVSLEWFSRVLGKQVMLVNPEVHDHFDVIFCCVFYESLDPFQGLRYPLCALAERAAHIVVVLLQSATVYPDVIREELLEVFAHKSALGKIHIVQAGPSLSDEIESKLKETVTQLEKGDQEPHVSETVKALRRDAAAALEVASRTQLDIASKFVAYQLERLRAHVSNPATVHKDYFFRLPTPLAANLQDVIDLLDEEGVECTLTEDCVYHISSAVWL
jgi:hypothetical protein